MTKLIRGKKVRKNMTPQEKIISEANKYVMPAVNDYLAARCLLLNNIFVGLTLAHEAVEKLMKAIVILENIMLPKSHNLEKLADLLLENNSEKYKFLNGQKEFIKRLDQHYGWRYYDGNRAKRSQSRSPEDLNPLDALWIALYELYTNFLPQEFQFRTYLFAYLFDDELNEYTNWGTILKENNNALQSKLNSWEAEYKKIFNKK